MLVAEVVDEPDFGSGLNCPRTSAVVSSSVRTFASAVGGLLDGFAVDAERDVVQEDPAVHLRHIDRSLDSVVAERIQRADEVMSIDTEIERKVVPGAGRNADEGKTVGACGRGHDGERPVAARHAERVRPVCHGSIDERSKFLVRTEDDGIDPSLACPLDEARPRCPAVAGACVDEQDPVDGPVRSPASRTATDVA